MRIFYKPRLTKIEVVVVSGDESGSLFMSDNRGPANACRALIQMNCCLLKLVCPRSCQQGSELYVGVGMHPDIQ